MKLSVNLVTWNGEKYIPYLFDSLKKQNFKKWELLVWDNNSEDDTIKLIEKELSNFNVQYQIFESSNNIGFAGGHNKLFKKTNSDYFLLLNQDIYLGDGCFKRMVKFLDNYHDVVGVSPRLMRWNFTNLSSKNTDKSKEEILNNSFTNRVDAVGFKVFKNRRVIEWLTQEEWSNRSKNKDILKLRNKAKLEVFGLSGALSMFRKSSIEETVFENGNFLDEFYHSYKEDVDLAYRLRSQGMRSFVLLDVLTYHDRTAAGPKKLDYKSSLENKRRQSKSVKFYSYRNHLITLYKNEYWQNFILDFPFIFWYELRKFLWFLFFDKGVLKGLKEIKDNYVSLKKKRSWVKKIKKSNWRDVRRWWS